MAMKTKRLRSYISFLVLWTFLSLHAQDQAKIDSLIYLLNREIHDTVKIDLSILLHRQYLPDSTMAMDYINNAIDLSDEIGDKGRFCRANLVLVHFYLSKGSLKEAQNKLREVRKNLYAANSSKIEADYYAEQGWVSYQLGKYKSSATHFLKAQNLYEVLGDTSGIGQCYNGLGSVHWRMHNLDKALDFFRRYLNYTTSEDKLELSKALGNIGLIYRAKIDYEKALSYYQKSLDICQNNGFKLDAAINLQNMGVIYEKQKHYNKALAYLTESNSLSKSIGDRIGVLYTFHGMAAQEANLGNFQKAISQLREALNLALELKVQEEVKNIYMSFAELYEKMGAYKKSLDYRKEYELWKDSLISENHLNVVRELEVKYETEKKDQQITLLAQEKEVQQKEAQRQATLKNAVSIGLLLIALLSGLLFYTYQQRLKNQKALASKNEEIQEVNFKRQLTELEMKALQAQINPHFIFNCMNSINQMILDGDNKNASKYLTKFGKLIRMVLENAESTEVSLKDELTLLEAYIQLEALRFNGEIQHKIEIIGAIDLENTYLPSMVLQPFVENAIWHGLMHRKDTGNGKIGISIEQEGEQLVCTIEDNGVGRQKAFELQQRSVYKSKSLGLKITEERLKLLSKELHRQLIQITDLKNQAGEALGTRVTVNIPIS